MDGESVEGEIYIGTLGLSGEDEVNYRMEAQGTVWEGGPLEGIDFSIDTDGSHTIAYVPKTPAETVGNTDFSGYNWGRLRMIFEHDTYDTYGYGLYKFYVNQYNAYFYIDYRDSNYTTTYSNCGGHCVDIWIKYDAYNDEFEYIFVVNFIKEIS